MVSSLGPIQTQRNRRVSDSRNKQAGIFLDARCATRYTCEVIRSFRHKGLKRFFETGSKAGIQAQHANRLRLQLAALDTAKEVMDMNIPGYQIHPLKGRDQGRWSVWVNGNWRLTFEFTHGDVHILDYEDYH